MVNVVINNHQIIREETSAIFWIIETVIKFVANDVNFCIFIFFSKLANLAAYPFYKTFFFTSAIIFVIGIPFCSSDIEPK